MIRKVFLALGALALFTILASPCLAKEITVRGKLQKTVEAGGWLIVAGKQKYLILNPQKFQNETWFKEGTEVEATGETKKVMTIYMEGTPFEVSALHSAGDTQSVISGGQNGPNRFTGTIRRPARGLSNSPTTLESFHGSDNPRGYSS